MVKYPYLFTFSAKKISQVRASCARYNQSMLKDWWVSNQRQVQFKKLITELISIIKVIFRSELNINEIRSFMLICNFLISTKVLISRISRIRET